MKEIVEAVFVVCLTVIFVAILLGFPIMLLWNWLVPTLFGLPQIGFFQAIGLMMLGNMLFNSGSSSSSK